MKRGLYETVETVRTCMFPFSKEGGAVSGDTRRSQAVRMYPP
jgi:hypothetical protein